MVTATNSMDLVWCLLMPSTLEWGAAVMLILTPMRNGILPEVKEAIVSTSNRNIHTHI